MTFERYSNIIDNLLRRHWAIVEAQVTTKEYVPEHGVIQGKFFLLDGSCIDFSEGIRIIANTFSKLRYRYEFVKSRKDVFRYDNYSQHPGIRPPNHHRHLPNNKIAQLDEAPKLIDIIEEAIRHMF